MEITYNFLVDKKPPIEDVLEKDPYVAEESDPGIPWTADEIDAEYKPELVEGIEQVVLGDEEKDDNVEEDPYVDGESSMSMSMPTAGSDPVITGTADEIELVEEIEEEVGGGEEEDDTSPPVDPAKSPADRSSRCFANWFVFGSLWLSLMVLLC